MSTISSNIQLDPSRVLPHAAAYVEYCTELRLDRLDNPKYMKALSLKRSMEKGVTNLTDVEGLVNLVKMGLYV
jgi:hypothetical protein